MADLLRIPGTGRSVGNPSWCHGRDPVRRRCGHGVTDRSRPGDKDWRGPYAGGATDPNGALPTAPPPIRAAGQQRAARGSVVPAGAAVEARNVGAPTATPPAAPSGAASTARRGRRVVGARG